MALVKYVPSRVSPLISDGIFYKTYFKMTETNKTQLFLTLGDGLIKKFIKEPSKSIRIDLHRETNTPYLIVLKPSEEGMFKLTKRNKGGVYAGVFIWPFYCPSKKENFRTLTITSKDFGANKKFFINDGGLYLQLPE